jgi:hypothetical protein
MKLSRGNEVVLVRVIALEDLLDAVSGLEVPNLRNNPADENIKSDGLLDLEEAFHELKDEGVALVWAQFTNDT